MEQGVTKEQVAEFLKSNPRYASALHKAPHAYSGTGADLVAEVALLIKLSRAERLRARVLGTAKKSAEAAKNAPHVVVELFKSAKEKAPVLASRVKEDFTMLREERRAKKGAKAQPDLAAAAE